MNGRAARRQRIGARRAIDQLHQDEHTRCVVTVELVRPDGTRHQLVAQDCAPGNYVLILPPDLEQVDDQVGDDGTRTLTIRPRAGSIDAVTTENPGG